MDNSVKTALTADSNPYFDGFSCKNTIAVPMKFRKNGSFRILHLTDNHLDRNTNLDMSVWLTEKACDDEKPDLVIITGDVSMNGTLDDVKYCINKLMTVFEERKIPVAVCFGNHDSESGLITREELMAFYNSYPMSISVDEGDMLTGCGTYVIPVMSSDGTKDCFNLWVIDSGDYDEEKHYANVTEDKVKWYCEKCDEFKKANDGKVVKSLVFQHIIVPEIYDALKKVGKKRPYAYRRLYYKNTFFELDPKNTNSGALNEYPCPGFYNHGEFEAMENNGDVLGMFFGHDHSNTFSVKYKGIDLVATPSARYENESFSSQYGYRVIDLEEKTVSYKDRLVRWCDKYSRSDIKSVDKTTDSLGYNTVKSLAFYGGIRKTEEFFGHTFARLFTGRKVSY